ncbi:MAG: type II toxin-antitoxin system HicA family toxin [Actinobacteria bacterium]|nr:type II toxin-antitoxin system HicA family toxin [Actinomycetota bacterium]
MTRRAERCAHWSAAAGSSIESAEATHVFRHPDHRHRVVVPMHARDLARGTLSAIIEASGVSREEFLRRL